MSEYFEFILDHFKNKDKNGVSIISFAKNKIDYELFKEDSTFKKREYELNSINRSFVYGDLQGVHKSFLTFFSNQFINLNEDDKVKIVSDIFYSYENFITHILLTEIIERLSSECSFVSKNGYDGKIFAKKINLVSDHFLKPLDSSKVMLEINKIINSSNFLNNIPLFFDINSSMFFNKYKNNINNNFNINVIEKKIKEIDQYIGYFYFNML